MHPMNGRPIAVVGCVRSGGGVRGKGGPCVDRAGRRLWRPRRRRPASPPDADAGVCPGGVQVPSLGECTSDGWCLTNPVPQGGDLYAAFGSGPTDLWSVGVGGTILHGDGRDWSLAGLVGGTLRGGWAASPCDAWAVGDNGTIARWDGTSWNASAVAIVLPRRRVGRQRERRVGGRVVRHGAPLVRLRMVRDRDRLGRRPRGRLGKLERRRLGGRRRGSDPALGRLGVDAVRPAAPARSSTPSGARPPTTSGPSESPVRRFTGTVRRGRARRPARATS